MLDADRVLPFLAQHKRRPAKATLREDPPDSLARVSALVPILGQANPASVPVVEHIMQSLIDAAAPSDNDGDHQQPEALTEDNPWYYAPIEAQMRHDVECRRIGDEIRRHTHRNLIALLRDMGGPAA
jgi:hypothetical protein